MRRRRRRPLLYIEHTNRVSRSYFPAFHVDNYERSAFVLAWCTSIATRSPEEYTSISCSVQTILPVDGQHRDRSNTCVSPACLFCLVSKEGKVKHCLLGASTEKSKQICTCLMDKYYKFPWEKIAIRSHRWRSAHKWRSVIIIINYFFLSVTHSLFTCIQHSKISESGPKWGHWVKEFRLNAYHSMQLCDRQEGHPAPGPFSCSLSP